MINNLTGENNKIMRIIEKLDGCYGDVSTELRYENSFQLLLAVILSAQSTDSQVNRITDKLFKKYKTPEDFANLAPQRLALDIKGCGLYNNKSKYIVETACELVRRHDSKVPDCRIALEKLPGVGRKSAGVILNEAFGQNYIPVDTHVFRVAHRLGLANSKTPDGTEDELMEIIPKQYWRDMHHWLVRHGRRVCKARKPLCTDCVLQDYCPKKGTGNGF